MSDWSAKQYLKFADERTRAARDLLAQVSLDKPRLIYDLGCGPGNSTELLVGAYPDAEIIGVDSSPAMLATARSNLPRLQFVEGNLTIWRPDRRADLIFANAVFHWIANHVSVLRDLADDLAEGGFLAVQMPDNIAEPVHRIASEIARVGPWAARLAETAEVRETIAAPERYYDALKPVMSRVDIWHTIYNHPLEGVQGIVEWNKGTGLRPYLNLLDEGEQKAFLDRYAQRIAEEYPLRVDGKVLLRFPRLFIVAQR
jgi:trans-aconitate 2-methyltransferase